MAKTKVQEDYYRRLATEKPRPNWVAAPKGDRDPYSGWEYDKGTWVVWVNQAMFEKELPPFLKNTYVLPFSYTEMVVLYKSRQPLPIRERAEAILEDLAALEQAYHRELTTTEEIEITERYSQTLEEFREFRNYLDTSEGQELYKKWMGRSTTARYQATTGEADVDRIASSVVKKLDERMAGHSGSPPSTIESLGRQFPKLKEALFKLGDYELVQVHDDGDLTVRSGGKLWVVTTNGKIFEQKSNTVLD
jgi:hypothetical protein